MTQSEIDRFWSLIDRKGPDDCWDWQGRTGAWGYGEITIDGKRHYAHRLVFELTHSLLLPGVVVRHSCNRPQCCNPAHLRAGTHGDNRRDCVRQMRHSHGETVACHKLTEIDVQLIRHLYPNMVGHITHERLGQYFGCNGPSVTKLLSNGSYATWKHVTL